MSCSAAQEEELAERSRDAFVNAHKATLPIGKKVS